MRSNRLSGAASLVAALTLGAATGLTAQAHHGAEQGQHDVRHGHTSPGIWMEAQNLGFEEWSRAFQGSNIVNDIGDRPHTAFIADDAAYQQIDDNRRQVWQSDPATQRQAVAHTLVEGRLTLDELRAREYVVTVDGDHIRVRTEGDRVWIGEAEIIRGDLQAGTSAIHQVDRVIWPENPEMTRPQQPVEVTEPIEPEHERRPEATQPQNPPVEEPRPDPQRVQPR
jgi:uncharacterized surface protein with fasciclin (FAS1) repeats